MNERARWMADPSLEADAAAIRARLAGLRDDSGAGAAADVARIQATLERLAAEHAHLGAQLHLPDSAGDQRP